MNQETITVEQKETLDRLFDLDKKIESDEDFIVLCEPFEEEE